MVLIFVFDPLARIIIDSANISLRTWKNETEKNKRLKTKKKRVQKGTKIGKKRAANAKVCERLREISKKFIKTFLTNLGKRDLKNRDYEEFFRQMGTKELQDLGLDPDAIRIKLDQIMEWICLLKKRIRQI